MTNHVHDTSKGFADTNMTMETSAVARNKLFEIINYDWGNLHEKNVWLRPCPWLALFLGFYGVFDHY